MHLPTGDATLLHWKWRGAFGRRRPFSIPNITGPLTKPRPTDSHATTRMWLHWPNTRTRAWRLRALRRDYQAMRDMYLTEPASFDEILKTLLELEGRINDTGGRYEPPLA